VDLSRVPVVGQDPLLWPTRNRQFCHALTTWEICRRTPRYLSDQADKCGAANSMEVGCGIEVMTSNIVNCRSKMIENGLEVECRPKLRM
jgi:hypothetical protein